MFRSTRRTGAGVVAAVTLLGVAGACGGDDGDGATTTGATTTDRTATTEPPADEPTATTEATTTTTTTTEAPEGPDVIGEPTIETVQSDDFPGGFADTALLTDVRVGRHDGFTRVVLDFDGDARPSYRVGYIEPPARQPGSGFEIDVDGAALLELRLTPAAAVDLSGAEVVETYTGPREIDLPAGGPGNEVVFGGDFEANLAWIIGLDEPAPFAMAILEDPLRLVVDVLDG